MAFKTLIVARRKVVTSTFRMSLEWALAHRPRRPVPNAINAFRKAEAVFPSRLGDFDCLPRAIGLFAFLRHSALQPELIIGFKRHPFTAHAWVETNGEPVLESQTGKNRVALFREILRVC
ncbi:MAG: lasso peptide biosynthesis B2 protein [Pseudomonadota bacterium]